MSNQNWTELLERIEHIEKEVRSIKQVVKSEASKEQFEIPKEESLEQKASEVDVVSKSKEEKMEVIKKQPAKKWEVELGQKWLPRVFLFVLIIGFIWGFAAAVEEGWITEPVRIIIGFVVAILLYVLGEKQIKQHRKNLGVTLLAGTVTLLILTTFAMNTLYGYIGFWVAFILHVLWIGLGLYLSNKHASQVLGILVAIGGYFVPFLIEGAQDQNPLLFYIYETMLYGGYLIYAMKKSYKKLHYIAYFFLHIVTLFYYNLSYEETFYPMIMLWLQHFILLYAFTFYQNFHQKHFYTTLFSSFFLNVLWMNGLWNETQIQMTLLIVTCVYILTGVLTWKEANAKRTVALTMATAALGMYALSAFEEEYVRSILVLEGIASLYLAKIMKDKLQWFVGAFIFASGIIATLHETIYEWVSPEMLAYGLSLGAFILLFVWRKEEFYSFIPNYKRIATVLLAGFSLIFLTQITNLLFLEAEEVTNAIAISVAWLLYAICFIAIGKWKNSSSCNIFGIYMLFAVLLKVIFVDLSVSSITVKAVLFVTLGAVGLVVSRFFYQNDKRK